MVAATIVGGLFVIRSAKFSFLFEVDPKEVDPGL